MSVERLRQWREGVRAATANARVRERKRKGLFRGASSTTRLDSRLASAPAVVSGPNDDSDRSDDRIQEAEPCERALYWKSAKLCGTVGCPRKTLRPFGVETMSPLISVSSLSSASIGSGAGASEQ